jgi:hypothetical protein
MQPCGLLCFGDCRWGLCAMRFSPIRNALVMIFVWDVGSIKLPLFSPRLAAGGAASMASLSAAVHISEKSSTLF